MLADAHRHNAKAPIEGPDEHGAFLGPMKEPGASVPKGFPRSSSMRTHCGETRSIACRNGRTVLTTGANAAALRLYAASHVMER